MITLAPTTEACVACRTRDCCRDRDAPLTGSDIVRIARALAIPPATFADVRAPDAVILRRRPEHDGRSACVFLLALGSRRRHCGLGVLAPTACRLHPAEGPEPGACWRTFTAAEVAPARLALGARHATEQLRWESFLREHAERVADRPYPLDAESFLDAVLAAYPEP